MATQLEAVGERINSVQAVDLTGNLLFGVDVKKLVSENRIPGCYSIMRSSLQNLLLRELEQNCRNRTSLRAGKRLINAVEDEEVGVVSLLFDDGSTAEGYNMVFGADGVNSVLLSTTSAAPYSGLRVAYCVSPLDPEFKIRPKASRGQFSQFFGDGCYALAASYGEGEDMECVRHMLAVVYREDVNDVENSDWVSTKGTIETVNEQLKQGGLLQIDEIKTLFESCMEGRFIDLGVRTVILSDLAKKWSSSSGRRVILGDAAHAMAPFLGQGANQAIQDSFCIAQSVAKFIADTERRPDGLDNPSLQATRMKEEMLRYERKRKLRTAIMGSKAGILGYIETLGGEWGMSFRDNLFHYLGKAGIVDMVFMDGANPTVLRK